MLNSCGVDDSSDDGDDNTQPSSKAVANLSGGDTKLWLLKTEKLEGIDVTARYKVCELDDVHAFDNIDNYNIDAGATKCTPPEDDSRRGRYVFNEDETVLSISFLDTSFEAKIVTLEENLMVWEIVNNDNETIEKTFKPLQ